MVFTLSLTNNPYLFFTQPGINHGCNIKMNYIFLRLIIDIHDFFQEFERKFVFISLFKPFLSFFHYDSNISSYNNLITFYTILLKLKNFSSIKFNKYQLN